MNRTQAKADRGSSRNRLTAGAVVFVGGQMAPLLIPLVTNSSMPASWKTALSGVLLLGIPEFAVLLAIVILGKAGFNELKSRLFGSLKDTLFPDKVSRRRYQLGLVLFLIPVLVGWLSPYVYEVMPEWIGHRLTIAVIGDLLLMVGVCLMGGQFWDKLRALVVYDAEVTLPSAAQEATA